MTNPENSAAPETTELDTSKLKTPNEDLSQEPTPIGDEAQRAAQQYLKEAREADLTHFDEDDDPLSYIGPLVDDDEKSSG
jgi:hypothetical protein